MVSSQRMRPSVPLLTLLLLACQSPAGEETPEGALGRVAWCIDGNDAGCLYHRLDRESQWSVQTIHKTLAEIGRLAQRSYPAARRDSAFGAFVAEGRATDPPGVFGAWCDVRGCLERVARTFGAPERVRRITASRVEIRTVRGGRHLFVAAEGRFGLADFADDLARDKVRLLDRLEQVKVDANQFDEQRRAIGPEAPPGGGE